MFSTVVLAILSGSSPINDRHGTCTYRWASVPVQVIAMDDFLQQNDFDCNKSLDEKNRYVCIVYKYGSPQAEGNQTLDQYYLHTHCVTASS